MLSRRFTALAVTLLCTAPMSALAAPAVDSAEILALHNQYRQPVGVPALSWSSELASSAQAWADQLASSGQFRHSSTGHGENIWAGTAGAYTLRDMVTTWGDEKAAFKPGVFPDVTTGGVVGHYTQIIWRTTQQVGCGLATGGGSDYFVCQYDPPGNYIGSRPF